MAVNAGYCYCSQYGQGVFAVRMCLTISREVCAFNIYFVLRYCTRFPYRMHVLFIAEIFMSMNICIAITSELLVDNRNPVYRPGIYNWFSKMCPWLRASRHKLYSANMGTNIYSTENDWINLVVLVYLRTSQYAVSHTFRVEFRHGFPAWWRKYPYQT